MKHKRQEPHRGGPGTAASRRDACDERLAPMAARCHGLAQARRTAPFYESHCKDDCTKTLAGGRRGSTRLLGVRDGRRRLRISAGPRRPETAPHAAAARRG